MSGLFHTCPMTAAAICVAAKSVADAFASMIATPNTKSLSSKWPALLAPLRRHRKSIQGAKKSGQFLSTSMWCPELVGQKITRFLIVFWVEILPPTQNN